MNRSLVLIVIEEVESSIIITGKDGSCTAIVTLEPRSSYKYNKKIKKSITVQLISFIESYRSFLAYRQNKEQHLKYLDNQNGYKLMSLYAHLTPPYPNAMKSIKRILQQIQYKEKNIFSSTSLVELKVYIRFNTSGQLEKQILVYLYM